MSQVSVEEGSHQLPPEVAEAHVLPEIGGGVLENEYPAFGIIALLVLVSFVFLWLSGLYLLGNHYPGDLPTAIASGVIMFALNFAALWRYRDKKNNLLPALMVISSSLLGPVLFYACASWGGYLAPNKHHIGDNEELLCICLGLATVSFILAALWRFPALSSLTVIGLFGAWFSTLGIYDLEGRDFKLACLIFGVFACVVGCLIGYLPTANYKYWVNKVGLVLLGFGLTFFWHKDGIDTPYILIALLLLLAAVFFRYPSFAATGLLALVIYVNVEVARRLGQDSIWLPIILFAQAGLTLAAAALVPALAAGKRSGRVVRCIRKWQPKENSGKPFQFLGQ